METSQEAARLNINVDNVRGGRHSCHEDESLFLPLRYDAFPQDLGLLLRRDDLTVLREFSCNYCKAELYGRVRIKCVECPDLFLCVSCFSGGNERGSHKCSHKYAVKGVCNFPVLVPNWTADEEVVLLLSVAKCGNEEFLNKMCQSCSAYSTDALVKE
eukprot:GHVU01066701.1.p1 GENE.GHVU01066701.1~~GHVU01066701.1.p1  ORF type:complete len:158 (+),score=5.30 GHVU01066701.1:322-795(+)